MRRSHAARGEQVFVWRRGWRGEVAPLAPAEAAFMSALLANRSLAQALDAAGEGFDFAAWLARALEAGWLRAVRTVAASRSAAPAPIHSQRLMPAARDAARRREDEPMTITRRRWLGAAALLPLARPARADSWQATLRSARGQTVYFNAWAGSERINAYLQWAAAELDRTRGLRLEHVKIADTAEAVQRIRAEKAAGRARGSIDMVWINGENFLHLKREALLVRPVCRDACLSTPMWTRLGKPTTRIDFSEPVEGMEAPWGMAQLTFYADRRRVPQPPLAAAELLAWSRANAGASPTRSRRSSTARPSSSNCCSSWRPDAGRCRRRSRTPPSRRQRAAVGLPRAAASAAVARRPAVPGQHVVACDRCSPTASWRSA